MTVVLLLLSVIGAVPLSSLGPQSGDETPRAISRDQDSGKPTWAATSVAASEQGGSQEVSVVRLGGANRFATARRIGEHHARDPKRVYLTTGIDFPDALTAGAIAGGHSAPVLLSGRERLPDETRAALEKASPEQLVVIGGERAVPSVVAEGAARAADASLRRIAGRDRFDTARLLAKEARDRSSRAHIAAAEGFADSLTGGAAAAADGGPLLLTASDQLSGAVRETLETTDPAALTALGGPKAVSGALIEELRSIGDAPVRRVAGLDRFATAVAVSRDRFGNADTVYLANGTKFPDALSGGAAAGAANAPLLLSPADALPPVVADELGRLKPSTIVVLGGEEALSDDVISQARRASIGSGLVDPAPRSGKEPPPDENDHSAPEGGKEDGGSRENKDAGGDDPDRVLSGQMRMDGFTVPQGEVWTFEADVDTTIETTENVVVEGTLRMKPSSPDVVHTLKFIGVDETQFVGGHTDQPLPSDVGLWVVEDGQLDLQGTPRAGWNRTGNDPTWREGDEVHRAPIKAGETEEFPPFNPGQLVPSVTAPDGSVHHTEVFNLTRNVRIHGGGRNPGGHVLPDNGRAHVICLMCKQAQTIKHVELRWMGTRTETHNDSTDGLLGRYALHFHHSAAGTRGSIVEGVVVRDAGNHAFVPHASHGITFTDTIAFDTYESAYWWDHGDNTNDVTYDHAAAFLTRPYPAFRGYALDGFTLGQGINMSVRNSVVVGMQGQKANSGGFHWPSSANQVENNTWNFNSNVAHNNRDHGLSVWQNDSNEHIIEDYVGYHNGGTGVAHGAYGNTYVYRDLLLFGNGRYDILHKATSNHEEIPGILFEDSDVGTIRLGKHVGNSDVPNVYRNTYIREHVTADEDGGDAGIFEFRYDCGHQSLVPSERDFDLIHALSDVYVVDECSGTRTVIHSR